MSSFLKIVGPTVKAFCGGRKGVEKQAARNLSGAFNIVHRGGARHTLIEAANNFKNRLDGAGQKTSSSVKNAIRSFSNRVTRNDAYGSYTYLFDDKPIRSLVARPFKQLAGAAGQAVGSTLENVGDALTAKRSTLTRSLTTPKGKARRLEASMHAPVAVPEKEMASSVAPAPAPAPGADPIPSSVPGEGNIADTPKRPFGTMVLDQSLTGYGIKKREDGNYQVSENLLRLLQTGLYS